MLWVVNFVDFIKKKIKHKFNFISNPNIIRNMLVLCLILICLMLLFPLFWAGFYNHMSGDDWYNARFAYAQVLDGSFSLKALLEDCFLDLIDLYTRWSFTYTGYFLAYIMPAGFGEQYVWLHTVILLSGTVIGMYVFITRLAKRIFKLDSAYSCVIAILLITVMIQYMPSPFDGFYWWSGSINNTVGFFISILGITFLVKMYTEPEKIKIRHWIMFGLGLFLIAGTSYGSVLVLFSSMTLVLIDVIIYKKINKRQRVIYYSLFGLYIISILFAMSAPGNRRRGLALEEGGVYGLSAFSSILHAYVTGVRMILDQLNLCYIIILIAICILILPTLIRERERFRNPILVVFTLYSVYITSFIPTFFANGTSGEPRVANIQSWYAVIFFTISVIYCLGWYLRTKGICNESKKLITFKREILIFLIMIGMVIIVIGEPRAASRLAMKGILTGEVRQFDMELDLREEIYKEGRGKDIIVPQLTNIPEIFEGYTDLREEKFWINSNVRDYYQLSRLRITTDIQ